MASSSSNPSTSGSSVEDQMRNEIERLTATINQHKYGQAAPSNNKYYHGQPSYGYNTYGYGSGYRGRGRGRGGATAGPHMQYVRPGLVTSDNGKGKEEKVAAGVGDATGTNEKTKESINGEVPEGMDVNKLGPGKKEVIIGGVAFEASKRSLVRKDLPKPKAGVKKAGPTVPNTFVRQGPQSLLVSRKRMYKPKGRGRNMTLDNTKRSYTQSKRAVVRKIDKPCSKFTKTGTCSRGLTCPYQHDPNKIAICWKFMQDDCPNTAETCNLSHNPTPERTPLCVHFLNRGRCTKERCLFPHVNVGKKEGVCKDFAVLGYCDRGVGCDKNHVRECPEFEETGECRTKGCKLPHVIKANAKWAKREVDKGGEVKKTEVEGGDQEEEKQVMTSGSESGQMGDEYISLIFNESDSDSEEEEEEEGEEEESGEEEEEEEEEGEMEVHA